MSNGATEWASDRANTHDDAYLRASRRIWDNAQWMILHDQVRPSGHVLDVGCGNGENTARVVDLRSAQVRLTGVDISEAKLRAARDRFPGSRWMKGNAMAVPLPDSQFDVAFCVTLLCELDSRKDEPRLTVHEMARVTRPGGLVFCVEPAQGFAAGCRTLELRAPQNHTEEDAFWSPVRYAYLLGCTKLHGTDYHIGVTIPRLLESAGLCDIWMRGMMHVVYGLHYLHDVTFLKDVLVRHIKPSWYPSTFGTLIRAGGLPENLAKEAERRNAETWEVVLGAMDILAVNGNDRDAKDILSRLMIAVPFLAVGGRKSGDSAKRQDSDDGQSTKQ